MAVKLPEIAQPQTAYVANMTALWEHAPALAQQADDVDDRQLIECEPSQAGPLTCQLVAQDGKSVYLHSRYDPVRQADRWADGAKAAGDSQRDKDDGTIPMCYLVDGFGLGYHVKALFDSLAGDAFIVVSEPNVELIRTALAQIDYSEMLSSDRLVFITRANRQEIFQRLQPHSNEMMMGVVFTRSLQSQSSEHHKQVHRLISEYASYLRSHLVSLLANGVMTCRNVLKNLPTYVGTSGVGVLKNRFDGIPAVVVSAGPSLGRNINLLKQIRDRVVVIAVQTTLRVLLEHGIKPDFVTSLDYHEVSKRFFEQLDADLTSVHMVAEPKATWHVIDAYRKLGPISLLGNEFARLILGVPDDAHDELPAGATVAHLAFYLAEYLGSNPIIFVGQDLAFSDNVYYSPGNALHSTWQPELNRFCTMEMKEWERIVRHRGILRQVEDIHGQDVYTDEQMFTYLQQFEKDFAKSAATVIDASEGGAIKRNCQTMTLAEVADKYCCEAVERGRFEYLGQLKGTAGRERQVAVGKGVIGWDVEALTEARRRVKERIRDVEELREISEETVGLVREMLELVDDQAKLNEKMVRLDELRTMVKHRPETYRLVMYVSQAAEMFRFRQDRILDVDGLEGKDRQRRQLQRDVGYVSEIRKGCERLCGLLDECVERFDAELGGV